MIRINVGGIWISCYVIDMSPLLLFPEMNREVHHTRPCAVTINDASGSFSMGLDYRS